MDFSASGNHFNHLDGKLDSIFAASLLASYLGGTIRQPASTTEMAIFNTARDILMEGRKVVSLCQHGDEEVDPVHEEIPFEQSRYRRALLEPISQLHCVSSPEQAFVLARDLYFRLCHAQEARASVSGRELLMSCHHCADQRKEKQGGSVLML